MMKKKPSTILSLLFTVTLVTAYSHGGHTMDKNTVFPKGDRPPQEVFTNENRVRNS